MGSRFQIHRTHIIKGQKVTHACSLNGVDQFIAKFWDVEVHPKHYASPRKYEAGSPMNWFDTLGLTIARTEATDWDTLRLEMLNAFTSKEAAIPYLEIIDRLEEWDFIPVGDESKFDHGYPWTKEVSSWIDVEDPDPNMKLTYSYND